MIQRSKRSISLFMACAMLLSIIGGAVDAAVATLISPKTKNLEGRIVDVSVKYDSQSTVKIDSVALYIDNIVYEKKRLDPPSQKGIVSFDWDTKQFAKGQHFIEVKLFSNNKLVTAVSGLGIVSDNVFDVTPPVVGLANVKNAEVISGTKIIRINAKDDSGESPIVSLLVDKKLKLMQNTQPYSYSLDTTSLSNGEHAIEVYAFDVEGNQSDVSSYKVIVNNGSAVVDTKVAKVENQSPVALVEPEVKVASAPSLFSDKNNNVGRISDNEVSASFENKTIKSSDTKTLITSDSNGGVFNKNNKSYDSAKVNVANGVSNVSVDANIDYKTNVMAKSDSTTLNKPSINLDVPKASAKNAAILVASNNVTNSSISNVNDLKLSYNTKSADASLSTPKTKAEVAKIKPADLLISNNIVNNDFNSFNELKLAYSTKAEDVNLSAPSMKTEVVASVAKVEVKSNLLVASNVTTVASITNELKLKHETKSADVSLNTPTTKVELVKPEAKDLLVATNLIDANTTVTNELKLAHHNSYHKTDFTEMSAAAPTKVDLDVPVTKATPTVKATVTTAPKAAVKVAVKSEAPKTVLVAKAEPKAVATVKAKTTKNEVVLPASGQAKIRDIVADNNGTLLWDNKEKKVTAFVNNIKVEMTIGNKRVMVNGNPVIVNLIPQIKNGRTIIDVTDFKKILATPALKK